MAWQICLQLILQDIASSLFGLNMYIQKVTKFHM